MHCPGRANLRTHAVFTYSLKSVVGTLLFPSSWTQTAVRLSYPESRWPWDWYGQYLFAEHTATKKRSLVTLCRSKWRLWCLYPRQTNTLVFGGHTLKGTLARAENHRQVPVRRRFGNKYTRLGTRARDLQPKSVFRGCRMVDASTRESWAL